MSVSIEVRLQCDGCGVTALGGSWGTVKSAKTGYVREKMAGEGWSTYKTIPAAKDYHMVRETKDRWPKCTQKQSASSA